MPIEFANWLRGTGSIVATQTPLRAAIQESRIQDDPVDVVFMTTNGVKLAPQAVRIEWDDPATAAESPAGQGALRRLTLFGYYGHPELDDTNIAKGYRFNFEGKQYTVIDVVRKGGKVQARTEAVG